MVVKRMPESSVKITLGIELDKSEIGQQIQEMQKELDSYRLKIGVDREQLTGSAPDANIARSKAPKSFESADEGENVDFGPLSDLATEKFNETFKLVETANNSLSEILSEIKSIRSELANQAQSNNLTSEKAKPIQSESGISGIESAIKEAENSITTQMDALLTEVSTISANLENTKGLSPISGEKGKDIGGKDISSDVSRPLSSSSDQSGTNSAQGMQSAISSGLSSVVSAIGTVRDGILPILTKIAETLLPEVIKQVQFDFLKSLIGGAVGNFGAKLTSQVGGGAAKVLSGVMTGNSLPGETGSNSFQRLFSEGFNANDPSIVTTAIEAISMQIASLKDGTNSQQECACLDSFQSILDALSESVQYLSGIQSVLGDIQSQIALLPGTSIIPGGTSSGSMSDPGTNFNYKDYTDADYSVLPQGLLPSSTEIDPELLTKNFEKIARDVFSALGINFDKVLSTGSLPKLAVDTQNKLEGGSKYDQKTNTITIDKNTAQSMGTSEKIIKEAFIIIVHELRHAIQTSFGRSNLGATIKRAEKGTPLPLGTTKKTELLKLSDLRDASKGYDVSEQVSASLRSNQNPATEKGKRALEIDAEVFAQNLADIIFPGSSSLLRGAKGNNAKQGETDFADLSKDLVKILKDLTKAIQLFNVRTKTALIVPSQKESRSKKDELLTDRNKTNLIQPNNGKMSPALMQDVSLENTITQEVDSVALSTAIGSQLDASLKENSNILQMILEQVTLLEENVRLLGPDVGGDSLFRAALNPANKAKNAEVVDNEDFIRGPKKRKRKTIEETAGEWGDKIENALGEMASRTGKKLQKDGMSEEETRTMADQAAGYAFANLAAFFPSTALDVALLPLNASLAALKLPFAAAVAQLNPLVQMMTETMRTINPIETRFNTIGGSPEKGADLMQFAETVSRNLNTPLLASLEGYSKLTAAAKGGKLEGQDTQELFVGISNAISALGLNAQDASLIFLAFQQVISKGKVAAEELRGQIGERLPGVMQMAAKSMDMSLREFGDTLDRGEIQANTFLPKFGPLLTETYGPGAEEASKSFIGSLTEIENEIFNLQRLLVDQFGGALAKVTSAAAKALNVVVGIIDQVVLKSGLLFNAIMGVQAQILLGTAVLFSKFNLSMALAKLLSGQYAKLSLVLIPFFFGLFQEILGDVFAKVFGIQVEQSISLTTNFFKNTLGLLFQIFQGVADEPIEAFKRIIAIVMGVRDSILLLQKEVLGFVSTIGSRIENLGKGFGTLLSPLGNVFNGISLSATVLLGRMNLVEKSISNIAKTSANQLSKIQFNAPTATPGQNTGQSSGQTGFNGEAIARASIEMFGLFIIMIQSFVLIRIIGKEILNMISAATMFRTKFTEAMLSLRTGKSLLGMMTLGFAGFQLVLAGLFSLMALMVVKSDVLNSFFSEYRKVGKDLEMLAANLDKLTSKKIEVSTEIKSFNEQGVRDTPFQDKGLNLTPWRRRGVDNFTTDDMRLAMQRQIDSNAYRRDLPLIPVGFNKGQGGLADTSNLQGLGGVLSSTTGEEGRPQSFDDLIELRKRMTEERSAIEQELTITMGIDFTNTFEEINRLKSELDEINSQSEAIQNKKSQGYPNPIGNLFVDMVGIANSVRVGGRKQEIESQLAAYQTQTNLAPGGSTTLGLNPIEQRITSLQQQLKTVDERIRDAQSTNIPVTGTSGFASSIGFNQATVISSLEKQRQSLIQSIDYFKESIDFSAEAFDREIKKRNQRISELENPNNSIGKTGREGNTREIARLESDIANLSRQKQAALVVPLREELSRINQDLRAINLFANNPSVFNNAFNQDDTVLREIVSQQLDLFSMVQNDTISPDRLNQQSILTVLPELRRDVQSEQDSVLSRLKLVEENIAQRSGFGSADSRVLEIGQELAQLELVGSSANTRKQQLEQQLSQVPITAPIDPRTKAAQYELEGLDRTITATNEKQTQLEEELAQLDSSSSNTSKTIESLNKELKSLDNALVGLKGLNIFLGIAESYAALGAGKQSLDENKVAKALADLSDSLKNSPVQTRAGASFQSDPTLQKLALLEQDILIELPKAKQGVIDTKSQKQLALSTPPNLQNEMVDVGTPGALNKDQKNRLIQIFNQEQELKKARETLEKELSRDSQVDIGGLDVSTSLDSLDMTSYQLRQLNDALDSLRVEKEKILAATKDLDGIVRVDTSARDNELASIDRAITSAENRVAELNRQFSLIQKTKSEIGGIGQIQGQLESAAEDLKSPLRGFAGFRDSLSRSRAFEAEKLTSLGSELTPSLEGVSSFILKQEDLSFPAKQALVGGLNSGDFSATKQALDSFDIANGKVSFNGEELTGSKREIKEFTEALKKASNVLRLLEKQTGVGTSSKKTALRENLGLTSSSDKRSEIASQYRVLISSLAAQGVFTENQVKQLTQEGIKIADAEKIIAEVKNQDGSSNFQATIQAMQTGGASSGDIKSVLDSLQKLDQLFVDAYALDPRGSVQVRRGTRGEEEYTNTEAALGKIEEQSWKAARSLGIELYRGNIAQFEAAIKESRPGLAQNIDQIRALESQLQEIGNQRLMVSQQLSSPDITTAQRLDLESQAASLDSQYTTLYRQKKTVGMPLSESQNFYEKLDTSVKAFEEKIRTKLDEGKLSPEIGDIWLERLAKLRKEEITPALDLFGQWENLMASSGEEALEAAIKAMTRALETFESTAKLIDETTSRKLADVSAKVREVISNPALLAADFSLPVAVSPGDPTRIRAENDLASATINEEQSRQKLEAARRTKQEADTEFAIAERNAAFSPRDSKENLMIARDKKISAQEIYSQAEQDYAANFEALADSQLALLSVEAQAPVRVAQFNSKQRGNSYKQQQLDRVLKEDDVRKFQLQDEIGLLNIQIASNATELNSIVNGVEEGIITDVRKANAKIDELSNAQQDLIANRLDKLLEQENLERERSIKLLENQSSLSSKYFDVAINGYELLNKETERYTKQLENLTQVGEQLKTLSQAQFQVKIGRSENQLSIADAGVATRERLSAQDLSPRERSFQKSRLSALSQLGQSYGVQPAAFGANEDAALAEQQKIATKLAKDKLDAMEKEQAIAAKLLDIELQRNQIAAEMAVREAEISKLRAEQAVTQAQFGLQQALLGTDDTAIKLAELELQIAKSQQGLSDAELGSAKENLALQSLFAQLQKEAFNLDSASARDGLITEVAGNQNVDIASILQSLKNFKDFDPNKANPREVFKPYLDWIESQTPKRDPNTPIGLPLEAFNGDIQAWMNANVAIAKQDEANKKSSAPAEIQSLESLFTRVFGAPVASKIDISNGPVKDIGKEIASLNAGRLGEKVAPTQEMIDSVSGQRDINNALEQARRLAQATEPIDNSRMASDIYSISTSMADSASSLLIIKELLGRIALGGATGVPIAVPDLGNGGIASDNVKELIDSQQDNLRGILNEIVLPQAEDPSNGNGSKAVPVSPGTIGTERLPVGNQPYTLDLRDSILPPPAQIDPATTMPSSPEQKVSNLFNPTILNESALLPAEANTQANTGVLAMARPILNPTIQNSVTTGYKPPDVNVAMQDRQPDYFYQKLAQTPNIDLASAQREPGYFYRNLASEVSPQVAYRVPPGIQATQGATSYRPASNTTINITNKIDAASQREMYAKIGETQSKSILSALNQLA